MAVTWEAVLLAGGKLDKDLAAFGPLPGKAYIPLKGRPLADYPLKALQAIPQFKRIVAVLPENGQPFPETVAIQGGTTIIQSIGAAMKAVRPDTTLTLITACDLPLLTPEAILDFMHQCEKTEAGLYYSFVSKQDSEKRFPQAPHTYVQLVEGTFCGGGLIAIAPKNFQALIALAEKATQNRKNILGIAKLLGIPIIFKLLLKKLSIPDAEKRVSELLGFPAKGIQSHFPEIAFNIDDRKGFDYWCSQQP